MTDDQKNIFKALVDPVFELYGQDASKPTLSLWWNALKRFEFNLVREAFNRHVQDPKVGRFAPKPADIIGAIELMIPDGRITADEAWALYPHDESSSAVITNEMAEAMSVAQDLINSGDRIAGRMAFKAAYDRIVAGNKQAGISPKWFPSLGHDESGREQAIKTAFELGRINQNQLQDLTPKKPAPLLLQAARTMLECKKVSPEVHNERMKALREALTKGE